MLLQAPGDLWVELFWLKHEAQQHVLDSVTVEIQVQLYAKLAPDSTNAMSLLLRSNRYKARVSMLGGRMRAVDWIWVEISGGGQFMMGMHTTLIPQCWKQRRSGRASSRATAGRRRRRSKVHGNHRGYVCGVSRMCGSGG